MPPAIVAAGIGAAGVLGGAALSARAQNKATSAQAKSTDAALDYTREQDALRRAEYARALEAWNNNRNVLLQHLGLPAMSLPSSGGVGYTGGAPSGGQPMPVAAPQMADTSADLVPVMNRAPRQGSLAEVLASRGRLGGAFDWEGLGLRPRSMA